MKVKTTIRIRKEVLEKAQKYGLNLSKTVENLLLFYLEGIEQIHNQIQTQNKTLSSKEEKNANHGVFAVDGAGFEPAASTMPTWRSFQADLPAHGCFSEFYGCGLGYKCFD